MDGLVLRDHLGALDHQDLKEPQVSQVHLGHKEHQEVQDLKELQDLQVPKELQGDEVHQVHVAHKVTLVHEVPPVLLDLQDFLVLWVHLAQWDLRVFQAASDKQGRMDFQVNIFS